MIDFRKNYLIRKFCIHIFIIVMAIIGLLFYLVHNNCLAFNVIEGLEINTRYY